MKDKINDIISASIKTKQEVLLDSGLLKTIEKVVDSLVHKQYEVKVPKQIADKARVPIERMLMIS